ncbi:MAG TPA: 4-(cytidine 5'-diphospho)-2-C-methyl-D-erythritol kinase [Methylophilaceae bacterium]|nr:4-(cytidine 5'-diphospho)-2-C-methyl-D-erythritol kinase [Methylophilaceae bacterium]
MTQNYTARGFEAFPAPAKVNLFLHVIGQRADGYHLLQTVFRLLDFHDTIYIKPRDDAAISRVNQVDNVPEAQDLCVRAAKLLQQHTGCRLGVDIAVDKRIPMGGGLGGGSSDAATVLLALNRRWNLHLSREELLHLGLQLGADVPVFIFGRNAWAEGIGERLQTVTLPPAYYLVLTPPAHVSTAQVFASKELTRNTNPTTIAAFSGVVPGNGQSLVRNDLESVVCKHYPAVASCLEWLNQFSQARMSGSGASVFASFESREQAELILSKALQEIEAQPITGFVARGLKQHPLYDFAA